MNIIPEIEKRHSYRQYKDEWLNNLEKALDGKNRFDNQGGFISSNRNESPGNNFCPFKR